MTNDAELLRQYAEDRSEDAFAEFVRRHVNLVYAAALRRTGGRAHDASEITQQVFIAAARHARALARHRTVSGWLYTATRNAALNLLRGEQRRQRRELAAQATAEIFDRGEAPANWETLRPVLDGAIDELAARDREIVLLRFFEGQGLADIGTRLSLSENAVRMRVERALDRLRTVLRRRGVTSTNTALALLLSQEAGVAAPAGLAATVTSGALAAPSLGPVGGLTALVSKTQLAVTGTVLAAVIVVAVALTSSQKRQLTTARPAMAPTGEVVVAGKQPLTSPSLAAPNSEPLRATNPAVNPPTPKNAAPGIPAAFASKELLARGNDFLRAHPEVREMFADYTRLRSLYELAPSLEPLGLTASQIEALVQAKEKSAGLYFNMADNHIAATLSLTGELPNEHRERVEADIRAILGEEGYRRHQELQRIRPAAGLVAAVAGSLYWSATPLTAVQARELTGALLEASGDYQRGESFNAARLDWDGLLPKARAILSEPQFVELAGLRAGQRYAEAYRQAQADYRKLRPTDPALSWKEYQAGEPALEAMRLESNRAGLQRRYGALFRGYALPADQFSAFAEAIVRHDAALLDLEAAGLTQRLNENDPTLAALRKNADAERRAALLPVLGEAGYGEFEEYERSGFVPAAIAGLGGALLGTSAPLTPGQADELTRIILRASPRYQGGGRVDSNSDFMDETAVRTWRGPVSAPYEPAAILEPTRAVLSERQFAYFGATWAQVYVPKIMNTLREFRLASAAPNSGRP